MAHLFNRECLCCKKYLSTPRLPFLESNGDYGICDKCFYELMVNPKILPEEPLTNRITIKPL